MSSLVRKIEKYNINHRGFIRKSFSYIEVLFLLVSIPVTYLFSNIILGLDLIFDWPEYLIFGITVLISWYIKKKINSQAKIPRTQRYLYMIFYNSQTFIVVTFVVILFKFLFRLENIPVSYILVYLSFYFSVSFVFKLIGYRFLKIYRANGYNLHHVLIIADGFSDQIIEKLIDQKEWGFKIRGIVSNSKLIRKKFGKTIPIISEQEELSSILDKKVIDEVIYSKYKIDENQVKSIMKLCNEVGIIFRLQSTVSPIEHENFQFKTLNDSKFLTLVDGPSNHSSYMLKTITDYYFSILAIIALSPLFFFIAILIKLDSKGPIFFKQERIGLRGRKFKLYKFRTMVVDAEDKLKELKDKNESDGPVFKIKNDPRITRVGRFLRKSGLDELPQLQNVVLGEMSLIGPRPPLESEVKQYERWQLRRLSVKPGITCSWQVAPHRNDVKFENWMQMDLNYIDNWSITKDVGLFFKTVLVLFFAEGR
jgi:exopolysaccharide biosynthesis polyprenyl glycosylphosphotransferase